METIIFLTSLFCILVVAASAVAILFKWHYAKALSIGAYFVIVSFWLIMYNSSQTELMRDNGDGMYSNWPFFVKVVWLSFLIETVLCIACIFNFRSKK